MFDYQPEAIASILETSLDAVFTIDDRGRIVDFNKAAVRLFGHEGPALLGSNISLIVPPPLAGDHDGFLAAFSPERGVSHVLGSGQRLDALRRDGSTFPVEVGISSFLREGRRYFTGFVRDMSERQHAEDRMRFIASHDALTQLFNLHGFLSQTLDPVNDQARILVLRLEELGRLMADYGQASGELALQEIALRLHRFAEPGEIVARVREDAFALLLPQRGDARAEALLPVLARPVTQGAMHFPLTVTLGLSRAQGTLNQRFKEAQLACDRALPNGRGRINPFCENVQNTVQQELRLEQRLREAVHNGALNLVLQPKVQLANRRIVGAEALVRWHDAELGHVSPVVFIPVAERLGLIGRITAWVLERSLEETRRGNHAPVPVAVNFSSLDFFQPELVSTVEAALLRTGAKAEHLVIELTESVVADDPQQIADRMTALKALGTTISLDDFGTGYSSLSYLREFPIDSLKIDASFVRDLPEQADAAAIANAVVALAQALDLETIAEGVETEAQADFLTDRGVDLCQGYLFSKPVPPEDFHRLLNAQA